MTRRLPRLLAAGALALCALMPVAGSFGASPPPRKTLPAFASEKELADLFARWAEENRRRAEEQRRLREQSAGKGPLQPDLAVAPSAAPAPAAPAMAKSALAGAAAESVTNVQHAGVDEGGIVKVHGEHLVVLRRGRLSTVSLANGGLKPVASMDAFGPGIDPRGAWYDEMLLWQDTVIVIGYSYARGGTEIGLFDISPAGQLAYRGTWHLRSNDYYSSRNYASRLIGSKLVFYTPLRLNPFHGDPFAGFPALRKWRPGATGADFQRIAPATRIYRTDEPLDPYAGIALHTVSVCDLAKAAFDCDSTAVMGPPGRVFYASPGSVYVWATAWRSRTGSVPGSSVFRIPLDGGAPSALKTAGSPVDQFSFHEGDDGHLNVLLRAQGGGEGMWAAEAKAGDLALLRVPLASFSDGRDAAPANAYRALPRVEGHSLQNRYVGEYLLYGTGAGWRRPGDARAGAVQAVRYAGEPKAYEIALPHGVDRIESMGAHAVVVGADGRNLHFTSVRLGNIPVEAGRYTRRDAAQGETRSHGFFYKADTEYDGIVGLPIVGAGEPGRGQLRRTSASVLYLRNRSLGLTEIGTLDAQPLASVDDGCRASCVDWYGNSRPLFLRGRVFALMGYEIVEGRLRGEAIAEVRRTNFSPLSISWSGR